MTRLLADAQQGSEPAIERLIAVAYDELRDLAASLMRRERPDHTLQPTALVHEAAMRLLGGDAVDGLGAGGRSYFFGTMARAMRRVLVDHARARRTLRRGGGDRPEPLDTLVAAVEQTNGIDLLALDEALRSLELLNPRQAQVVGMRFFAGLEMPEIARELGVSLSTVEKDWKIARAWLMRVLGGGKDNGN